MYTTKITQTPNMNFHKNEIPGCRVLLISTVSEKDGAPKNLQTTMEATDQQKLRWDAARSMIRWSVSASQGFSDAEATLGDICYVGRCGVR
jgi:hypothetical protein